MHRGRRDFRDPAGGARRDPGPRRRPPADPGERPSPVAALRSIGARDRHDPRGLVPEEAHLLGPGHNLLQTGCGPLDALGAIDAGLAYDDLLPDSEVISIGPGLAVRILSLRRLVELKSAAGRPKDLAVLPTLRATLAEIEKARSG